MNRVKVLLVFVFFVFNSLVQAQVTVDLNKSISKGRFNAPRVEHYVLSNGLNVYLNEDHSEAKVTGAVVVRGGASRDPKGATGIAHYFEHIMFKGTTQIGTIDYQAEKVYLDSIAFYYDLIGNANGNQLFISEIQKKINQLSLKAARYAIPNEFDKIISEMGGTGLNAYTTYENIVYHNTFPPESMEKWLKVYSNRFQEPVFRLFQSELETVYEEKNMSMDNFQRNLFESLYGSFYPNSVYGRQTVLGSIEHLKNPSLTLMMSYFKEYYNASNMALVLVGDFNATEVKPLIERWFGPLREGSSVTIEANKEAEFDGRVLVEKKLTPVPLGVLGFRTISSQSADKPAMDIVSKILSNENGTGLLDQITSEGAVSAAMNFSDQHLDVGAEFILFVPKIPFQSLNKAEKCVMDQLSKLAKGDFDDTLFYAVKNELLKNHLESMENLESRQYFIIESFMQNREWTDFLKYSDEISKLTKKDVVAIANKYFGKNYLAFHSKIGFPKKTKLEKPGFDPITNTNNEASSAFAQEVRQMPRQEVADKYIDFALDANHTIFNGNDLYVVKNPMNNIFNLQIKFGVGNYKIPEMEYAADYLNLVGSTNANYQYFRKKLQSKGVSITSYSNRDYFILNVSGYDEDLYFALQMLSELLNYTEKDSKKLDKMVKDVKLNRKMEKEDLSTKSSILYSYAFYGENSPYLKRLSISQIKGLNVKDILNVIGVARSYKAEIHLTSNVELVDVTKMLDAAKIVSSNPKTSESPLNIEALTSKSNKIFLVNDKNAIQSHIKILMPSEAITFEERYIVDPFNDYFGTGMYSLVFQEIREFRSLAYSSWGRYSTFPNFKSKSYFVGGLTTQADKTNEAITAYMGLLSNMPQKPERIESIKQQLLQSNNSEFPGFREISQRIAYYQMQGLAQDPNQFYMTKYRGLQFQDLESFYANYIQNRPYTITIVGDKEKINLDELKKYGEIIEFKLDKLYR